MLHYPTAIFLCALLILPGCEQQANTALQGYVEGEYVYLAAPFSGYLETLAVTRGSQITQGSPVFALEHQNELAARENAAQKLRAAQAQLADLQSGKRPQELDVIKAQMVQADAAAKLSATELKRIERLIKAKAASKEELETAQANDEKNQARIVELQAQLAVAELAARPDTLAAAEANVSAAQATLAQADWSLAQKTVNATRSGLISDTFFSQGEWVAAGNPVVSILPAENRKVRFFVPEPELSSLHIGQSIRVDCDGCKSPIAMTISYIAPQSEYTPPVIYSKESRQKLVVMVEAKPDAKDAELLPVGLPVDVLVRPGNATP